MALEEDELEMKSEHVGTKFMRTDSDEYDGGNNDNELYVVTSGVHRHPPPPLPQAPQQITPSGIASTAGGPEEKEKRTRSRKWSDEEVDLFLKILGDARYMFAASLENLVPKKRSNYEIFSSIKNVFKRELKERHRERYPGFEYSMSLDLSIEKLRKKYSNLKVEWRRMSSDRQGKEETLAHFPEPRWYRSVQKLMTDIKVASEKLNAIGSYDDSLSPLENGSPDGGGDLRSKNSHHNDEIMEEPTFVVINNRSTNTSHSSSSEPVNNNLYIGNNTHAREYPYTNNNSNNKGIPYLKGEVTDENHNETNRCSPVYHSNSHQQTHTPTSTADISDYQYPYKRSRLVCRDNINDTNSRLSPPGLTTLPSTSSTQLVGDLANGLKQLAELQMKRQQMIIEADFKTYDLFLRHKEQEAEKNRAHELNLAEIYAKALTNSPAFLLAREVPHSGMKRRINGNVVNEPVATSTYKTLTELEREMTSPSFSMHYTNGSTRVEQIWRVVQILLFPIVFHVNRLV